MPNWLLKCAIHQVIARLPQRQRWNAIFQKYGTKSLALGSGMFEMRVRQCRRHLESFLEFGPEGIQQFNVVELGTGWFPTLALGMHLCGASKVWTFDIDPLLDATRLSILIDFFCDYDRKGALATLLPQVKSERIARLQQLRADVGSQDPVQFLNALGIHFAVRDARNTGLPTGVANLVFSHGVLEYIPRPVIAEMFQEFRRVSAPGAVMSHYIDLADQYHYFDRRITSFNFLRFTPAQWKWFDSPLMPQNRLRISDYRALHGETRWDLLSEESTLGSEADLSAVPLAPEFRQRDRSDLIVIKSWMVSKRRA